MAHLSDDKGWKMISWILSSLRLFELRIRRRTSPENHTPSGFSAGCINNASESTSRQNFASLLLIIRWTCAVTTDKSLDISKLN